MTARTRAIVGIAVGLLLGLCPILIPLIRMTAIQRGIEALDKGEASTPAIEAVFQILHTSIALGSLGLVLFLVSSIALHRAKKQLSSHLSANSA